MSKRAEEAALKAYPPTYSEGNRYPKRVQSTLVDTHQPLRTIFLRAYEQAEKDIIKHCEKRIAEYNAQNLSNMFLRRAFEDVIRFIKEIPYNDYKDEDDE